MLVTGLTDTLSLLQVLFGDKRWWVVSTGDLSSHARSPPAGSSPFAPRNPDADRLSPPASRRARDQRFRHRIKAGDKNFTQLHALPLQGFNRPSAISSFAERIT
jgi:hypothetical protein